MNQMDDLMLPPLPKPFCNAHEDADSYWPDTYSADQLREYAKKAVEAERVSLHITTEMFEAAAEEYDQWADENKGTYECIRAMLIKAIRAR